jgi:tetratricopeptide (TPR) repeat protein
VADQQFAELVTRLMESMGQSLASVREVPEGILVKTPDGFLLAFVRDPGEVSLAFVHRVSAEVGEPAHRLVVLSNGRLPLALSQEVIRRGATLVEAGRFQELVRGLGLGAYLGEAPRAPAAPGSTRMLPSVQQLEEVMTRARTWATWGVPALALRFYRQATAMKPEFLPARLGAATSLLNLGLPDEADRACEEILATEPTSVDARLLRASILGRRGDADGEKSSYRTLLAEHPESVSVRAHLLAALVAETNWAEARPEVEHLIEGSPEDPALRYLHGAILGHLGERAAADGERARALALGLPFDRERSLAAQLGLPEPAARPDVPAAVAPRPPTLAELLPAPARPEQPERNAEPQPRPPRPARRSIPAPRQARPSGGPKSRKTRARSARKAKGRPSR